MPDIKVSLKEAKNAIKDKDYEAAMIHCKDALKIDKKNYLALTMFGRVCQEQHKFKDSKQALLLATQVDSLNPVAWQGLSSLHEKNDMIFTKDEEIAMLLHLKEITKEEEKHERIVRRLANVYQKHDCIREAVEILELYVNTLSSNDKALDIRKLIIQLLERLPTNETLEKLIKNFEAILDDSPLGENERNYQTYLQLIYKAGNYEKLMTGSLTMYSIFVTAYPLEWLARAYVECWESNKVVISLSVERLTQLVEKLLSLNRKSPWGNLANGLLLKNKGDMGNAKLHLRQGSELLETNLLAWLILLNFHSEVNDFSGVETTCRKILQLISTNSKVLVLPLSISSLEALQNSALLKQAMALTQLGHENHFHQAIGILEQIPNKDLSTSIMYIKALVKVKKNDLAHLELDKLAHENKNSLLVKEVTAFVARYSDNLEAAKEIYEEIIQLDSSNSEALFELGRIYFEAKDFQKSLISLLKAANFNPKMSNAFLYIGHCYRVFNNLDKARKCYEKALNLNPCDDEAGAALSDIYRASQDHACNLTLLIRVTSESGRCGSGWAWLRLGLHYLSQKNYIEAIQALLCAVEINKFDRICYECLGEAYLARGSHTAALKVFSKAVDLDPKHALYSRCKIAYINHIIGEYLISISQYEEVLLEELPLALRTVALVGLAEVLLARAKKYKQQQLLVNMKNDCLLAIRSLARVVSYGEGRNITIWKLLGDACTLQIVVPDSQSVFNVPTKLLDYSVVDEESVTKINKKEMMNLGKRCYCVGLHIQKLNAYLWHDLGVNIFLQNYKKLEINASDDTCGEIEKALTAVKKSITLDSTNFNAWNSLGVVTFFKGDYQMSQHAFIRSLELQPTVEGWTHLGALYLKHQDIHLAHEAFSQAQALDPGFVTCWVGQAMVADAVGHYEAFDLYRHTTLLGIHPESCLGHAYKVLEIACLSPEKSDTKINIHPLLPNASDCLIYYTREEEKDIVGLNLCGLALESLGMKQSAADVYSKAVEFCENETVPNEVKDKVLMNYGRTLLSLGKLEESVNCFSNMTQADFYSQCGIALSRLKANQFDEAYEKYTEALMWLAPDDVQKSHVFVALAFLQYKFHNVEQVKTLLFQSSSVLGLLALASLGLLQGDATLADAALCELKSYADNEEYVHHVAFLKATQAIMQGDYHKGKLILSNAILRHPCNASLWRFLSQHLLSMAKISSETSFRITQGAKAAASAATSLSQAGGDNDKVAEDVVMKAMSYLQATQFSQIPREPKKKKGKGKVQEPQLENLKEKTRILSLTEAQRAVFMCPSKPESWAMLIAAMGKKSQKTSQLAKLWSSKAMPPLKSWLESVQL